MRFASNTRSNQPGRRSRLAQLFWKRADQPFVEHERTARLRLEPNTEEETLTILVHDTLDQFRFDPDIMPGTFRIREMELLIKPTRHCDLTNAPSSNVRARVQPPAVPAFALEPAHRRRQRLSGL